MPPCGQRPRVIDDAAVLLVPPDQLQRRHRARREVGRYGYV